MLTSQKKIHHNITRPCDIAIDRTMGFPSLILLGDPTNNKVKTSSSSAQVYIIKRSDVELSDTILKKYTDNTLLTSLLLCSYHTISAGGPDSLSGILLLHQPSSRLGSNDIAKGAVIFMVSFNGFVSRIDCFIYEHKS